MADGHADRLRLDDVVGAVDFREALAFGGGTLGDALVRVAHKQRRHRQSAANLQRRHVERLLEGMAYSIGTGVLLLSRNDAAASGRCVESALALDDSLAGSTAAAASAGSNLGNGVPVVTHFA